MSELTKEILKNINRKKDNVSELIEETADVEIMLSQLKCCYNITKEVEKRLQMLRLCYLSSNVVIILLKKLKTTRRKSLSKLQSVWMNGIKNMAIPLLEIEDLYAGVDGKEIIKGFNLTINAGEVHALMGPNGAGKSTLSNILCGKPGYHVTSGRVLFKGQDLLKLSAEDRAREGLFLSMQYPFQKR